MDTHRPVDVLPDRGSATVATWLATRPGIGIVCRDRAGAYAEAVRASLPDAIQVVDRYHLWRNLGEAVDGPCPPPLPARGARRAAGARAGRANGGHVGPGGSA